MDQQTGTLVVAGLGITGTLVSGVVGHLLVLSGQRKQSRRENIMQESRELLAAFMRLAMAYLPWARDNHSAHGPHRDAEKVMERHEEYSIATRDFHRVLYDRIFIAEQIKPFEIKKRWDAVSDNYLKDLREEPLITEVDAICSSIAAMALKTHLSTLERFKEYVDAQDVKGVKNP